MIISLIIFIKYLLIHCCIVLLARFLFLNLNKKNKTIKNEALLLQFRLKVATLQ